LKDEDFRILPPSEQTAYFHYLIGIAYFVSEKMSYADAKMHLKFALPHARQNPQLMSVILHNLAVINYCELTDHNERVMSGDDPDEDQMKLEQIGKVEKEKSFNRN
jgi:hypothetical protein